MVATKTVVHVADRAAEEAYIGRVPATVAAVEQGGVRTMLFVPMPKEDEIVGAFTLYRQEVRPFSDKQIAGAEFRRTGRHRGEHGCLTNCANHYSSRPPPPTSSKPSAAQRSICSSFWKLWSRAQRGSAGPRAVIFSSSTTNKAESWAHDRGRARNLRFEWHGVQDVAAARVACQEASRTGIGVRFDLSGAAMEQ